MKTKVILMYCLIAFFAIGFIGCDLNDDEDAYSLGKFWVGFGLLEADEPDGSGFTITMDDGSVLYPATSYYSWHDIEDYDRVLVNYTILGDKRVNEDHEEYYVRINSLKDILFKDIFDITAETEDSIGSDPIHVDEVWLSNSLLTFELDYYGYNKVHYINLVKPPGDLSAEDEPIELELRHNNREDEPVYNLSALVTFDLTAIQIAGQDSVQFRVTGDDFEGEGFSYTGVYRY